MEQNIGNIENIGNKEHIGKSSPKWCLNSPFASGIVLH